MKLVKESLFESNDLQLNYNNTYWEVTEPFFVYVMIGTKPSNSYYGASRIHEPIWEKIELEEGDQIHALVGGTFVITKKDRKIYEEPHLEKPEFAPFEHKRDYNSFKEYKEQKLELIYWAKIIPIKNYRAKNY